MGRGVSNVTILEAKYEAKLGGGEGVKQKTSMDNYFLKLHNLFHLVLSTHTKTSQHQ